MVRCKYDELKGYFHINHSKKNKEWPFNGSSNKKEEEKAYSLNFRIAESRKHLFVGKINRHYGKKWNFRRIRESEQASVL